MLTNSQVNDKRIASRDLKTHERSKLILVRLGTDPMKHYGTSTLFYIKLHKNLYVMIIMKSVSVFRREIGENIFLHPVEGKFGRFVFLQPK